LRIERDDVMRKIFYQNCSEHAERPEKKPPIQEPPNQPKKPPVKEPDPAPEPPPPPDEPPVQEPPNRPQRPPVEEPPENLDIRKEKR
jgi:hypothetical protein